jgi:hypothetical protein
MKTGIEFIAQERTRQITDEGHDLNTDAVAYPDGDLWKAAISYLQTPLLNVSEVLEAPLGWPWANEYWKPTPNDRIRELSKAGALIAAEIDRINIVNGKEVQNG